jgi:trigger factor
MRKLKLNIETREDHQAKIIAEFEPSDLDKYKIKAARRIASKSKIPGFRPGKAPYDVVSRLYGEPAIEEDAIELMMEAVYPEILVEAKIDPASSGTLEDVDKGDPIKFTFVVPLQPTVTLGNYKEIRKTYSPKSVTEKQVNEFIHHLRRTYATAEPVERPAAKGDLVYIKLDATLLKPGKEENPELLKDRPLQLVIGENDPEENDYPYPGFGDNLIGLNANDAKKIKYTYPKDSKFEKLRGKEVEFNVLLQTVKQLTLPELNDDFAKMFGEYETFAQLKEAIKEQLQNRQTSEYDEMYYEELLDEVVKTATVKYPPQVLEHEMESIIENVTHDLSHQKMELDVYLKTINKEKEVWLEEEVKPAAVKNLSKSLVLRELAKAEDIELASEEIQTEVTGMLSQIQQTTNPKALSKQLKNKNYLNALTMDAASRAMSRKVFERLKDIATGKTAEVVGKPVKAARSKSAKEATDTVQSTDEQKPQAKKTKAAAAKEVTPATVKKTKKVEKTSE